MVGMIPPWEENWKNNVRVTRCLLSQCSGEKQPTKQEDNIKNDSRKRQSEEPGWLKKDGRRRPLEYSLNNEMEQHERRVSSISTKAEGRKKPKLLMWEYASRKYNGEKETTLKH